MNPLYVRTIAALLRHALAALGVVGVLESDDQAVEFVSAVVFVGSVIWSVMDKRKTRDNSTGGW